jgi:hypothetical protein
MEIAVLAILAGSGLTAIDIIYTARQVILPVYLLNAAVEVPLIAAWCWVLVRQRQQRAARPPLRAQHFTS